MEPVLTEDDREQGTERRPFVKLAEQRFQGL